MAAGCAGLERPVPHPGGTPLDPELMRSLLDDVRRVRRLEPRRRIPAYVHDDRQLERFLRSRIPDGDAGQATVSERVLYAFGLLARGERVAQLARGAFRSRLAAYFDLRGGYVVIRDSTAERLGSPRHADRRAARAVALHELVHALAAQRLGLMKLRDAADKDDLEARFAIDALVEGDATLAQVQYMAEPRGIDVARLPLSRLVRSGALRPERESKSGPPVVRELLEAPYLDGLCFVGALVRAGGWSLVDRAYQRPPRTSEQILHPRKYLAGEPADELSRPRLPALDGRGTVTRGTLGEIGVRTLLRVGGIRDADRAARGWGGDVFTLHATARGDALAWVTSWEGRTRALRFHAALERLQSRRGKPPAGRDLGDGCVVTPEGSLECIGQRGELVALVRGAGLSHAEVKASLEQLLAGTRVKRPPARPPFRRVAYVPEPIGYGGLGTPLRRTGPGRGLREVATRGGREIVHRGLGIRLALPGPEWVSRDGEEDPAVRRALGGATPLVRIERSAHGVGIDVGAVVFPTGRELPLGLLGHRAVLSRLGQPGFRVLGRSRRLGSRAIGPSAPRADELRIDFMVKPASGAIRRGFWLFRRRQQVLVVLAVEWPEAIYARLEHELDRVVEGLRIEPERAGPGGGRGGS